MRLAIRTYKELFNKLNIVLIQNLEQMGYHANAIITDFIQHYYDEYDPSSYDRTYQFLDSCVNSHVSKEGNKYVIDIFIDYHNLKYSIRNSKQVVEWANQGLHGGYDVVDDHSHFWNDAMYSLKEDEKCILIKDFVKFLEQRTGCKARMR